MTPVALEAVAVELARSAGAVLRERLSQTRSIDIKGTGNDLVTDADRAAEHVVLSALRSRFPDHGVLSEESGAVSSGGLRWIIDPLDGTTNYAHAVPHFSVSIAVEGPWSGGRAVLAAAVFDPMRDELFAAARGQGATLNGARLSVSQTTSLERSLLCSGFPYDLPTRADLVLGLFGRLAVKSRGMRRFGSAALDLAWLAAGRFDGYWEFGLKPWDVSAGALLVEEAGGRIACLDGAAWSPEFGDVVAAGPGVFDALCSETSSFTREHGFVPARWTT
ncbi:MAG: inositol monophosphatase [Archangiaceae bacterium]|nr:inositol monophosphatase [Archangiaceae bacterium]